jgi:membrane-associated phospholipid phosphatase
MPSLLLLALALTAGLAVGLLVWRFPRTAIPSSAPALDVAREVGETVGRHARLRKLADARLDPEVATGLALTVALGLAILGGALLGLLAYLVRGNRHLAGIDGGVASWSTRHGSAASTHVLDAVTQLGNIDVVVGLCVLLVVVETIRERTVWVAAFVVAVVGGEEVLTTTIKQLADRARPLFNPAAATLGPSFPSGHSATSAAFFAAAALLLGRWRPRPARAVLAGLAAGIAVGVATSRVLLDVHWVSDVIAGLALGWAWFAVCAIAFGGRILRFGAGAETAARVAESVEPDEAAPAGPGRARPVSARSPDGIGR